MRFSRIAAALGTIRATLAQAPQDGPLPYKIEPLEPKYFKELGSQRVKISYGPINLPSGNDEASHGHFSNRNLNSKFPCGDCIITGWTPTLVFADDGKLANANNNIWLHHIGFTNLNRTDHACENNWPERMNVNGNERSTFDFTLKGTRKAGYLLRATDHIFMAIEVLNMNPAPRTVILTIEFEYLPGTPANFDIVFPVWLDVKGNCLANPLPPKGTRVFTARGPTTGWVAPWSGDLILAVPHIHDGNTRQEISLNDKIICTSVPAYGETSEFVSHKGDSHGGHDHGSSEHHYHVSSISQCENVAKIVPGNKLTIASHYDMEKHAPMKDHGGEEEAVMAIQFLHVVRPREEGIAAVMASKPGNLTAFSEQVSKNGVGAGTIVVP
ncbi:hypothetical protein B0T14DRAFT_233199 [Immersiella caudata]|uniref:Uncharacterized protein n=1 Tax=Immersiella caudata TaxID=314043 RepID=A0AA39WS02_9PEZI|nr:hypothetical protein B0T14DRAFT_233199 [Immersiella caudata]